MISPAEHLKLPQRLCVCVLCTPRAAEMYGCGSGCRESEHTSAAQVLWSDVPHAQLVTNLLERLSQLLQCQVQQPDLVTRSLGVWASGTVFCFHFLNALQNIQIFTKTALQFAL